MRREEVEKVSRELEELLDMQEDIGRRTRGTQEPIPEQIRTKTPGTEELEKAQEEYARLKEEADRETDLTEDDYPEEEFPGEDEPAEDSEEEYFDGDGEYEEDEYEEKEYSGSRGIPLIRPGDGLTAAFVVPVLIPAQPMYVYLLFFLSDLIYMPIF